MNSKELIDLAMSLRQMNARQYAALIGVDHMTVYRWTWGRPMARSWRRIVEMDIANAQQKQKGRRRK